MWLFRCSLQCSAEWSDSVGSSMSLLVHLDAFFQQKTCSSTSWAYPWNMIKNNSQLNKPYQQRIYCRFSTRFRTLRKLQVHVWPRNFWARPDSLSLIESISVSRSAWNYPVICLLCIPQVILVYSSLISSRTRARRLDRKLDQSNYVRSRADPPPILSYHIRKI